MMWSSRARACGSVRSENGTDYRRAYSGNIFPFRPRGVCRGSNCCLQEVESIWCRGEVVSVWAWHGGYMSLTTCSESVIADA